MLTGPVAVLALAAVDLAMAGRLTMFFDLAFISLCLAQATTIRGDNGDNRMSAGFLPPLQLIGAFVVLALIDPTVLGQPHDSLVQNVIAGLTGHAAALAIGYGLFLAALLRPGEDRPDVIRTGS